MYEYNKALTPRSVLVTTELQIQIFGGAFGQGHRRVARYMFLMGVVERSGALTENPHADVGRTCRLNTEIPSSLGELNTGDGANCYTAALPYRESTLQFPCGKGHPSVV